MSLRKLVYRKDEIKKSFKQNIHERYGQISRRESRKPCFPSRLRNNTLKNVFNLQIHRSSSILESREYRNPICTMRTSSWPTLHC